MAPRKAVEPLDLIPSPVVPYAGTILDAMDLAGMTGPSWEAWRTFWRAVFALPMSDADLERYTRHTGRSSPPNNPVHEVWQPIGRRGGKSRNMGLAALFLAIRYDYAKFLAPGEMGFLPVIAADRDQAAQVVRYLKGLIRIPEFAQYVVRPLANSVEFTTTVTVEIATASFRTTRGFSYIGALCDEIAFWRSDDSAEPDSEILGALRPGMSTIPDAMLIAGSTPYARKGELYRAASDYYGQDVPDVLVWNADTLSMHPGSAKLAKYVADEFDKDPVAAASEYGQDGKVVFRSDVEAFLDADTVNAVTASGRREVLREKDVRYVAFTDPSGGSQDSWTLGIAHFDGSKAVLDVVREVVPPFSPDAVVADYATVLKAYGLSLVHGDHFGGEFPRELFRKRGITYRPSDHTKSDLYREALPVINAARCELLDLKKLKAQLCGLERHVGREGKDTIDHAPGGHDDVANAACGAVVLAARARGVKVVRVAL